MGQFTIGDKNNQTNYLSIDTDWKINTGTIPTYIAVVEAAQLITPNGVTLTFKQGAIISLIADKGLCIYNDNDLR